MAIQHKILLEIDVGGKVLYVTDKTGEYNAEKNKGGYGTPNNDLSQLAVICYPEYINPDTGIGDVLEPYKKDIGIQVQQSLLVKNSDEYEYSYHIPKDGHIKIWMASIKVAKDVDTYIDDKPIEYRDYYYFEGQVIRKDVGQVKSNQDFFGLIDIGYIDKSKVTVPTPGIDSVTTVLCQDLIFPKLSIEKGLMYQKYKDLRDKQCVYEAKDQMERINQLQFDLQGADYDFRAGLLSEARLTIKMLEDEFLQ